MVRISVILALLLTVPAASFGTTKQYHITADFPGDASYADSVLQVTQTRIESLIGPVAIESLEVFIVATPQRFDSLVGSSVPDWGAAVAIPHRNRIVIKSPLILPGDKSLGELAAHEYTHMALAWSVNYRELPRWLDEGMAMFHSAEWNWDDNLAMGWAVVFGNVLSLREIEHLNRFDDEKAHRAYSQSYLAFKYFLDTYGRSGLNILLQAVRDGRSDEDAFVAATGAGAEAFEREFEVYIKGRYNLATLFFDSRPFWIILAVLLVIGFLLARLRRRRRLRQLDAYEKLHSTDFDYGDLEKPDEDKPWD